MLRWIAIAVLVAPACKVDVRDYSGQGFACSAEEPCPNGLECLSGICNSEIPRIDAGADANGDGGVEVCLPPIELSDPFDGDTLGAAWTPFIEVGTTLTVAGGVLQLVPATANQPRFARVRSEVFDFAERRVAVEFPAMVNTATPTIAELHVGVSDLDFFFLRQSAGVLQAGLSADGVSDVLGAAAFDAIEHRWWQFRVGGGRVVAEVSPDGGMWTELAAFDIGGATDFAVTISAGTEVRVDEPGSLHIDNVNSGSSLCP